MWISAWAPALLRATNSSADPLAGSGVARGAGQERRRERLQILARRGPSGAVDEDEEVGARRHPRDRVAGVRIARPGAGGDEPAERRSGREAGEADARRIELPLRRARPHQLHRALAVERARLVVVARRQPVGEHERGDAPRVQLLGDLEAFAAVHQHDVGAARRDDHRRAVALALGRQERGQERRVERAIALRERHLARRPQGDVDVRRRDRRRPRVGGRGREGRHCEQRGEHGRQCVPPPGRAVNRPRPAHAPAATVARDRRARRRAPSAIEPQRRSAATVDRIREGAAR